MVPATKALTERAQKVEAEATGTSSPQDDDAYAKAVALVRQDGRASTSYVQRRLGIGYNAAATLIERMEADGVVSAADSGGKRTVLAQAPAAAVPEAKSGIDFTDLLPDGSRARPARVTDESDIERAGQKVNTEPSEAQKAAGNYQKGHLKLRGLDITIENPKGSVRTGKGKDGAEWRSELPAAYGYVKRTTGRDGDNVDVLVSGDSGRRRAKAHRSRARWRARRRGSSPRRPRARPNTPRAAHR